MHQLFTLLIISLLIFSLGVSGCQISNKQNENITNVSNLGSNLNIVTSDYEINASSPSTGQSVNSEQDACDLAKDLVKVDAINCTAEMSEDKSTWTALYEYGCESYCAGMLIINAKNSQIVSHLKF